MSSMVRAISTELPVTWPRRWVGSSSSRGLDAGDQVAEVVRADRGRAHVHQGGFVAPIDELLDVVTRTQPQQLVGEVEGLRYRILAVDLGHEGLVQHAHVVDERHRAADFRLRYDPLLQLIEDAQLLRILEHVRDVAVDQDLQRHRAREALADGGEIAADLAVGRKVAQVIRADIDLAGKGERKQRQ